MTKIIENKWSSDDEQKFDEILQLLFENEILTLLEKEISKFFNQLTIYFVQSMEYNKRMFQNQQLQKQEFFLELCILIKANSMNPKQLAQQLIQQRKIFYAELIKADPDLMFIEKDWNNGLNKIADIISDEVLSKRLSGKTSMLQRAQNLEAQYDQCRKGEVENRNLEGFDFHLDLINLNRIKGVDSKTGRFLLDDKENIYLSDLITVLNVYSDDSIKPEHKNIQFSLDPIVISEPNSDSFTQQEKVCFPDKIVNRNVSQDSELARVMFESDYLMKQMSLGVESDGKTQFQFPKQLMELGLKCLMDIGLEKNHGLCRLWLVPQVCTYQQQNDQYILNNVQVICQARQLEIINGKLQDKIEQDVNDDSYQFAEKFTQLYDLIASHYPIFNRLKQVFKAVALGKWMYENKTKMDFKQMGIFNKKIDNNPKIIPNLINERTVSTMVYKTEAEKIQVAKECLIKNNLPLDDLLIKIFASKVDDIKGEHINIQRVQGGIDSTCRKMERMTWPAQILNLPDYILDQIQIPFLSMYQCKICSRKIEYDLRDFEYCSLHYYMTCFSCFDLVTLQSKNLKINNQQYYFHDQCYRYHFIKDQPAKQQVIVTKSYDNNKFKSINNFQQGIVFKPINNLQKVEVEKIDYKMFKIILDLILDSEGGKCNHKHDKGGKTNCGITEKNYKKDQLKRNKPFKNVDELTDQDVDDYYFWKWDEFKFNTILDPNLAYSTFDYAVHSGISRAIKALQEIIGVNQDGIIGDITRDKLKNLSQTEIQEKALQLQDIREKFLENLCIRRRSQNDFLKGWKKRIKKVKDLINGDSNSNSNQQKKQQSMSQGGIDCNPELNQLNKIKGVSKLNPKFLIDTQENINISDLTTALSVFLDPDIPESQKQISFSLDPIILPDDQEFYQQEKVCWPDKFVKRNIIQDTELAQIMFESDFLLKQMSLGLTNDGITPFDYPKQLTCLGLKPYFEFEDQKLNGQQRIFRFLLVPQECTYQNKNDSLIIDDIKVMCKSQSMERIGNILQDKKNEEKADCASQFAAKFTEIYDIIAQHYPIFNRLKQLFKAVILGKWISLNFPSIDYQQLQPFIKKVNNNPKQIPVIKIEHEKENSRVPVYFTAKERYENAKEYLKAIEHQEIDKINQLLLNFNDIKGYLIKRSSYYAYGGVDANCQSFKEQSSSLIQNEENTFQEISIPFINFQFTECFRNVEEEYLININSTKCPIHHKQTCCLCLGIVYNNLKDTKCNIISEKERIHNERFEQIKKQVKKN